MNTVKEIDVESILDEIDDEDIEFENNYYNEDIEKLIEPRNSYRRARRMYKNKKWNILKNTCKISILIIIIIALI